MLDFSLAELALVIIVAVIFIGPKELPVVIRALAKGLRSVKELGRELSAAFDDLAKESGVKDIEREVRMIQGDDGKMYESFDIPMPLPKKPETEA